MNNPVPNPNARNFNISVEKWALFTDMLRDGYEVRLRVTGTSMSPFLESGDCVTLIGRHADDLKIGDIILCRSQDGEFRLHRLIAMKKSMLITKGDAVDAPDYPFHRTDYYGKVIRIEQNRSHHIKHLNMESRSVQIFNFLFAMYNRMKSYLICKYIGSKSKRAW